MCWGGRREEERVSMHSWTVVYCSVLCCIMEGGSVVEWSEMCRVLYCIQGWRSVGMSGER